MIVTDESLLRVDNHWAILAIGEQERDRGLKVANARLVTKAVGKQIKLDFGETPGDTELMKRLSTAYELAASEGVSAFINPPIGE
jgi:hypothetical protein